LNEKDRLLRPENYPSTCPGTGIHIFNKKGIAIGILNLQGRIFMRENLDCPFRTADSAISYMKRLTKHIFIDFHAEATSEKAALANYLDGRVTAVLGTHTHVQTADERILKNGTAFITDLGFCGSIDSIIGDRYNSVIKTFLTQMPSRFEVETEPPFQISGALVRADTNTGKATEITRFRKIIENRVLEQ
jgi:metallophosphoesterase (TIGR00282 family)